MAVNSSPLNPIPQDLMYDILVRLPVKSLLRFKCVCKEWYNLINSLPFIQHHLNKSSETNSNSDHHNRPFVFIHDDSLYVGDDVDSHTQLVKLNIFDDNMIDENSYIEGVGSCRGLFCQRISPSMFNYNNEAFDGFMICNPSTRHTSKPIICPRKEIANHYGFGYDIRRDDYKIVVIIIGGKRDMLTYSFLIYSLKADSWKIIPSKHEQPVQNRNHVRCQYNNIVYGNGMLHCIFRWENGNYQVFFQIKRFNLSSEEWDDDLSFPNTNLPTNHARSTFIDGRFCVCLITKGGFIEVWSMKEYGIKESWTKVLRVSNFYVVSDSTTLFDPIAYSRRRSSGVLIFYNNKCVDTKHGNRVSSVGHSSLIWYDPKYEIVESNELAISRYVDGSVYLCVESLISIPGSSQMRSKLEPPINILRST